MPGRSPHRRSPPPPPHITRHSPHNRVRARTPERHHLEIASSSRGRERREYRPSVRRSRSPVPPPKGRSFSPPLKRKGSPSREREMPRRAKISKSPVGSRGSADHGPYVSAPPNNDSLKVRSLSGSDRFRDREYVGDRDRALPQFRGPEGSVNFDNHELKKFIIEIKRDPGGGNDDNLINRNITNPDDIVPVRRPGMRGSEAQRMDYGSRQLPPPRWTNNEDKYSYNEQNEGARPLFRRGEVVPSSSKDRPAPADDYRRVVAIDPSRGSGTHEREQPRERARYSPPPYEETRRTYYPERERSPYEVRHRSPPREEYVEPREKRERRAGSREDLRRDLDVRRREERRYSPERRSYERESDLRTRINEKRSEPHPRIEEREHSSRRYESEKERHGRSHHSPPRERRRGGSLDRHEGSRSGRPEAYEREGGERRKRPHSREREDRGRDRYEHSEHYEDSDRSRRSQPYKTDGEPKRFYKHYEEKEFIPSVRGRGGPPIRRGIPMMRGRGIPRGLTRGFRAPMGGMIRGVPRGPFMPMRGFPPRFFPPY